MAQKVNPLAVRLGVNRGADSSWFSDYYYATLLSQDLHLREYLLTVTNKAAGTPPLDFKPGRCVIHHYPKISFVHFFFCRLVKNDKRRRPPRPVVTKRKPVYSYESILPVLRHQTATRANALRALEAPEASLGAELAPSGKGRPGLKQQHTGHAKASNGGLRAASTTRALSPINNGGASSKNTGAVVKHTFVKHILSEVLLAEPGKPAGKRKQDHTPPALSSLWLDDIAKPRLKQTSNQPSKRRALNHLSQGGGLGNLRNDQPNQPKPGLLNKATSLQTTTQYGPTTGRPNGVALGLKLAKLVEARLKEVRCAFAFQKALQTTTPSKCAVVHQRRSSGFSIAAPCRLRHKDTPHMGLRAVQLAGSLFMNKATPPLLKGKPSQAHLTNPKKAQALPLLLCTGQIRSADLYKKGAAAFLFKNVSSLRPAQQPNHQRNTEASEADLPVASSSPTCRVETSFLNPPSSEVEGGPTLGRVYQKRQSRPSALRFVVSYASGLSPRFHQTGSVAPGAELTTTSSLQVPAPSTQSLDLRAGTRTLWWPESRWALRRISHLLLFKDTNPLATGASGHKAAFCSTTGTQCQMLKLKRLFKPFLLESVPHFQRLLRLSGWTRLALHQAQAWPMQRHKKPKPLYHQSASTQAPAGDLRSSSCLSSFGPSQSSLVYVGSDPRSQSSRVFSPSVVRLNKKKALVVVSRRRPEDRLKEPKSALGLMGSSKAGAFLGATQRTGIDTPAKRQNGRATRVVPVSADNKTKGWLTQSSLHYYVMHYFSLSKTNRFCGDVTGHVQDVQRHVTEAIYLELPLNQSSHYFLSNIQSRIESHTGTFTSILPIKLTSVVYQTAYLVAQEIALNLEQKKSFRQICKSIFKQMGLCKYIIKGIRIKCSGRLNGAEIAKTECRKYGETSLHVFSEKIDYAHTKASTPYGILGVKVWIAYV
jgi:ribosomal protein S3